MIKNIISSLASNFWTFSKKKEHNNRRRTKARNFYYDKNTGKRLNHTPKY